MKRRTQILLEEDQYQYAKKIADQRNVSLSAIVREFMPKLSKRSKKRQNAHEFLSGLAKLGEKQNWGHTPRNLSTTIDDYLYGKRSKFARISSGKQ